MICIRVLDISVHAAHALMRNLCVSPDYLALGLLLSTVKVGQITVYPVF